MKSIKQVADEFGYSKPYIMQTIRKLGLQSDLQKNGNKFVVSTVLESKLREYFANKTQTISEKNLQIENNSVSNDYITFLKSQLEVKDQQINSLNERLREMNIMLNASRQELSSFQTELLELKEIKTTSKKWWLFWKKF